MVAEQLVAQASTAMKLHGGRANGAMGGGRVVCFPDWETLERMSADDVKRWLLSKKDQDDAHYLAMIQSEAPSHRGAGVHAPLPQPRRERAQQGQPAGAQGPHGQEAGEADRSYADLAELATGVPAPMPGAPLMHGDVSISTLVPPRDRAFGGGAAVGR